MKLFYETYSIGIKYGFRTTEEMIEFLNATDLSSLNFDSKRTNDKVIDALFDDYKLGSALRNIDSVTAVRTDVGFFTGLVTKKEYVLKSKRIFGTLLGSPIVIQKTLKDLIELDQDLASIHHRIKVNIIITYEVMQTINESAASIEFIDYLTE